MSRLLEEALLQIHPYLDQPIMDPQVWGWVQGLAHQLPDFSLTGGFECRLSGAESRVDFCVQLPRTYSGFPAAWATHPAWTLLQTFTQAWALSSSPFHAAISHLWLEFDFETTVTAVPIPCLFFNFVEIPPQEHYPLILTLLKHLHRPLSTAFQETLKHCVDALPKGGTIRQLGLMLSRPTQMMRIVVHHPQPQSLQTYATRLGLGPGVMDLAALQAVWGDYVDGMGMLNLDVGDTIAPKMGLECYALNPEPHLDRLRDCPPNWERLLDELVHHSLCSVPKRDALLNWPGCARSPFASPNPQSALHLAERFLQPRAVSVLSRSINHLKFVLQPHVPLEVKIYLGFIHAWLPTRAPSHVT
ncbi:MAG: hypothetical protein WCD18_16085 [Thermosynechococcaceae cyanobacterium]